MISVQQAKTILGNNIPPSKEIELPLLESLNFCLAKDVFSEINMPPFRQSAMDGFALNIHESLVYQLIGEIKAGDSHKIELKPSEAIKIFTGAAVPDSANAVMQVEKTLLTNEILELKEPILLETNIRPLGEQIKKNEIALSKNSILNAAAIGFLAGLGITKVPVYKKPSVGILVTGNELVKPGNDLEYGKIYESNSIMLQAALIDSGFKNINTYNVDDDFLNTKNSIGKALQENDILLISGGMEHVRLRPSMYIGDVGFRGLHHLVYEVVDNSIDEALAGHCDTILVTIHEGESISVKDNGRGIPVDLHEKEQKSALEVVMTKIGAGGKFDKDSYKVSGGLHGVGVSCVNALSTLLVATVSRDGKLYQQKYSEGKALADVAEIGTTDERGTEIFFQPDGTIFQELVYNYDTLASRLRELSFLNKGITITLIDERKPEEDGSFPTEVFHSEGGLKEFVEYIDGNRESIMQNVIFMEGDKDDIPVEVAMRYNTSYTENLHSYVNNINTHEGGTHLAGFRRALTRTLKKYADELGLPAKEKVEVTGDDFREGLTAVISVKVMEPQFEGQTKTKLGNSEVSGAVDKIVGEMLTNFLEEHPNEAKIIVQKVVLAAKARQAAKKARELVQRKSPMGGSGLPGYLSDCSSKDPVFSELFLVEGDSAGGTA
jgi:hypothetical protein